MITIFTPTYNRINELSILYSSLIEQTNLNFIWSIVDDGSTDGTKDYVESISNNSPFKINYHLQNNSGKHVAINYILDTCKTDYLLCVDSDDYLAINAVEILSEVVDKNSSREFWAIVGPRFSEKTLFSNWSSKIPEKLPFSKIYTKYKYIGETYMLWNLKYFTNVRFPVFNGETIIPEGALYDILDQTCDVITAKKKVYYSDYLETGLTKNSQKSFFQNSRGYAYANYIASKNVNRTILNRSVYFGRCLAIMSVSPETYDSTDVNINSVAWEVRLMGRIISLLFTARYYLKK